MLYSVVVCRVSLGGDSARLASGSDDKLVPVWLGWWTQFLGGGLRECTVFLEE